MEEEIIIIVTRKQAKALSATDAAQVKETADGLVRTFTGPDRFKRAAKFIRAIAEVDGE